MKLQVWFAVAVGGGLGAGLRFTLSLLLVSNEPWVTLGINLVGAFALGALTTTVFVMPGLPRWLAPALGPGLLGGFTTMSALALDVIIGFTLGDRTVAALYLAISVVGGLMLAALGVIAGRMLTAPPRITGRGDS